MPPKKKPVVEPDSDSDADIQLKRVETTNEVKPKMAVTTSSGDNTRIKLANAIYNLTIKGDELMNAMKGFDSFRESIIKLDIETETKKQEYDDYLSKLEQTHKNKMKELLIEFEEKEKALHAKFHTLNKDLEEKFYDQNKKLENEYKDRSMTIQNDLKNLQISSSQKIAEFKIKACEEFAKENNKILIAKEDHAHIIKTNEKLLTDYDSLMAKYESECKELRLDEQKKYTAQLKNEMSIFELKSKAENSEIKAQVEQQKREIEMLNRVIENLKTELAEQRTLTKEVAQASSKSQITQKFGKDTN